MRHDEIEGAGMSGPLPYARPGDAGGNGGASARRSQASYRRSYASGSLPEGDASVKQAVAHGIAAGKRAVGGRLALLRLDLRRSLTRLMRGGLLLVIGVPLLVIAWFTFIVGGVLAMGQWWGDALALDVRLFIATALTALLGGILVMAGLGSIRARAAERKARPQETRAAARPSGAAYEEPRPGVAATGSGHATRAEEPRVGAPLAHPS